MNIAEQFATLSYAKRKQVGCIIVSKDDNIISTGFNGTPKGMDNNCEDLITGETLWYVLHSESNAITKLSRSTVSSEGSTMYITLSPCKNCAKLILQAGIKKVIFKTKHSCQEGIDFLMLHDIECVYLRDAKIYESIKTKVDQHQINKNNLISLEKFEKDIQSSILKKIGKYWLKKNLNYIANNYSQDLYNIVLLHLKYD